MPTSFDNVFTSTVSGWYVDWQHECSIGGVSYFVATTSPFDGHMVAIAEGRLIPEALEEATQQLIISLGPGWRITPSGPRRLTTEETAFASQQQEFESLPEDQRVGVLGP